MKQEQQTLKTGSLGQYTPGTEAQQNDKRVIVLYRGKKMLNSLIKRLQENDPVLKALNFWEQRIKFQILSQDDFLRLLEAFAVNQSVKTFNLSGTSLEYWNVKHWEKLMNILAVSCSVQTFNLGCVSLVNALDMDHWMLLMKMLIKNQSIRTFCIGYNRLYRLDADRWTMLMGMFSENRGFNSLDLSSNDLGNLYSQRLLMLVDAFTRGRTQSHCLQVINLGSNGLGTLNKESCSLWLKMLTANPSIHTLKLSNNGLGTLNIECAVMWINFFHENRSLRSLDLSDNNFDKFIVELWGKLMKIFGENCNLHSLKLGKNNLHKLNEERWAMLMQMLTENRSLHTLDLSSNELGFLDVKYWAWLMKLLAENHSLHTLNLSDNFLDRLDEMDNGHWAMLMKMIAEHPSIHILDLTGNRLYDLKGKRLETLSIALEKNKRIIVLDISDSHRRGPKIIKRLVDDNILGISLAIAHCMVTPVLAFKNNNETVDNSSSLSKKTPVASRSRKGLYFMSAGVRRSKALNLRLLSDESKKSSKKKNVADATVHQSSYSGTGGRNSLPLPVTKHLLKFVDLGEITDMERGKLLNKITIAIETRLMRPKELKAYNVNM